MYTSIDFTQIFGLRGSPLSHKQGGLIQNRLLLLLYIYFYLNFYEKKEINLLIINLSGLNG
jgi:hypothetical protein